jgi:hypothetical protein
METNKPTFKQLLDFLEVIPPQLANSTSPSPLPQVSITLKHDTFIILNSPHIFLPNLHTKTLSPSQNRVKNYYTTMNPHILFGIAPVSELLPMMCMHEHKKDFKTDFISYVWTIKVSTSI